MNKSAAEPDYILLGMAAILVLLGLVILASVSAAISQEKFGYPAFYLLRQIIMGLLPGIILGFAAFKIPLSFFKKWSPLLLSLNILLLILVFVPKIGISAGGASRWINLGFTSFQPSELLKLSFVLYLAVWLSSKTEKSKKFSSTFIAFLIIIGLIGFLLVKQPDVSTLGIIVVSAVLIYFSAGTPLKHTLFMFLGGATGLVALIKIAPYRFERFLVFLMPDIEPMGISYQIKQALIAIGSGGILGRGLGMSVQKFGFLPHPMSDSIFAIFSEETGYLGSFVLILLFLIFAWRGLAIAKKTQDKFSQLACVGISSWITLQAFVNIGSLAGILPLAGIPLPFISHGGSALVTELIGVGILLNISKHL